MYSIAALAMKWANPIVGAQHSDNSTFLGLTLINR